VAAIETLAHVTENANVAPGAFAAIERTCENLMAARRGTDAPDLRRACIVCIHACDGPEQKGPDATWYGRRRGEAAPAPSRSAHKPSCMLPEMASAKGGFGF
jgi:hypothetical protein